jgi:hypothetical protein
MSCPAPFPCESPNDTKLNVLEADPWVADVKGALTTNRMVARRLATKKKEVLNITAETEDMGLCVERN